MIRPDQMLRRIIVAMFAMMFGLGLPAALAVTPDETLRDPALEARARTISQTLRCVVCQNQSIDDSNAPLAHDLRVLVRDRLKAGDSDDAALGFIVARYGNFVLLKPPVQGNTLLLWFGPLIFLLIAAALFRQFMRTHDGVQASATDTGLTQDERRRLEALISEGKPQ